MTHSYEEPASAGSSVSDHHPDSSQAHPRPAAVFFDADGVLQRPGGDWLPELAGRIGPEHAPEFLRELFDAEVSTQTGKVLLPDALRPVLARWGLPAATDEQAMDQFISPWHVIETDTECLELVRSVRRGGRPAYLTTNQNHFRGDHMKAELPYADLFDGHFYSCDVGYAKPDPQYFRHVCEAVGVAPHEALFIDDRDENTASAAEVGLRTELFPDWAGSARLRAVLVRNCVPLG